MSKEIPLDMIGLGRPIERLLINAGIENVGQLTAHKASHLLRIKNFGATKLSYTIKALNKFGLKLAS